jgi:hypothetical protein
MSSRSARWLGIPAVVWVGGVLWASLLVIAWLACGCSEDGQGQCIEVFTDAFKVGLGAFIAMLAQWANKVFSEAPGPEPDGGGDKRGKTP